MIKNEKENRDKVLTSQEKQVLKNIVKKDLKALADEKYRNFHGSLCPGTANILGVRVPILRKYAKDFLVRFPLASYHDLDDEFYEEIMIQGLLLGMVAENDLKVNQVELMWFIPKIDNWAICDIFVSSLKFIEKNPEDYWEFVKNYTQKENEFEKRFAYVTMLSYYMKDEYIDEVLKLLLLENSQDHYVYMAVAWALSVALVKYYDRTLSVMKTSKLNTVTYNKAIQKACESYRITKEQKEELRGLKRRKNCET